MHKFFSQIRTYLPELRGVAIATLVATGLVLAMRQSGGLQLLEFAAYDFMVQRQPDRGADPRLLVVEITEADIKAQQRWPLPDRVLDQMLRQLEQHQPRAIGIDLYRDFPVEPGHAEFLAHLQASDRIFMVTKIGTASELTIPPPAGISPTQVGFNDVVVDPGGVIRRNLMFQAGDDGTSLTSFSLQLALRYLQDQGLESQASRTNANHMQLGPAVFVPLQPDDGGYVKADTRGYQILLNYRSKHHSVQTVTLTQLLKGEVQPDLIRDRIILIGTTAESGKDFFYTPYSSELTDGQRMAGVVVHAQMVSQFLDAATGERPLFWFWPEYKEILWIGLWAGIGGVLAWKTRHPLWLALRAGGTILTLIGACYGWFLQAGWVPLVPPALAFLIAGASVVTYTAQQAQRQHRMVMRLLGQSTSPEIAETLWQRRDNLLKDGKLPGQKLTATLLFSDLRGFSTISERLAPEALLEWLNEYLEEVTQVVHTHQGVINKFTGDGIMAAFGVPIPRETAAEIEADAQRAVACALVMGERLQRLNLIWQHRGLPSVEMRVGIFTGPIVVGSLGSKTRLEYGIIGDSVNTASRLESVDKHRQPTPCRILIAHETLVCLADKFEVEPWGPLVLKGKEKPTEVYRVIGPVYQGQRVLAHES